MKATWFENKELITLYTDERYFGADVPDSYAKRPSKPVQVDSLFGYEPSSKMDDIHHKDEVLQIALKMKSGTWNGDPIVVRKDPKGYQVLDGHHRMHAARKAGLDTLDAVVVDAEDIEYSDQVREQVEEGWSDKYKSSINCSNPKGFSQKAHCASKKKKTNEASGYIPTKAQANDPRFKTALTVDVRPGEDQRNISKLGLDLNKELVKKTSPKRKNKNSVHTLQNLGLAESLALDYQIMKEDDLFEVNMSPGALRDWAKSDEAKGIVAGFEMELIFADTEGADGDYDEAIPDWDRDEGHRGRSFDAVIDWFDDDEYGYAISNDNPERTREQMDEDFFEKADEWVNSEFEEVAAEKVREIMDDDVWDATKEERYDDTANELFEKSYEALDEEEQEQVRDTAFDYYLNEVDEAVSDQYNNEYWEQAMEDFREDRWGDYTWVQYYNDADITYMSDIAERFNIAWPFLTGGGGLGNRSWEEIELSLINEPLADTDFSITIGAGYHGTARRDNLFILEPDSSLESDDGSDTGVEIVSPPMPLGLATTTLENMLIWAKDPDTDAYTNGSTGLHMGISIPGTENVDYVKLVLFSGDKYILEKYGRASNSYTPSALDQLQRRGKMFVQNPEILNDILAKMHDKLDDAAEGLIRGSTGDMKYTSMSIKKGYIEFRSPGGDYLSMDIPDVINTMLRFARAMKIASDPNAYRQEYQKKLYKLTTAGGEGIVNKFNKLFSDYQTGTLSAESLKRQWANLVSDENTTILNKLDDKPDTKRVGLAKQILQPKPSVGADNAADSQQVQQRVEPKNYNYMMPMVDLAGDVQTTATGTVTATSEDEAKRLINTEVRARWDLQPLWSQSRIEQGR